MMQTNGASNWNKRPTRGQPCVNRGYKGIKKETKLLLYIDRDVPISQKFQNSICSYQFNIEGLYCTIILKNETEREK